MRFKIAFGLLIVVITVTAFQAGQNGMLPRNTAPYFPPRPVRTYPSSNATIQGWINADDTASIRRHGWDIWQSLTAKTLTGAPTWQSWYSGYELFEAKTGQTRIKARSPQLRFEAQPLRPGHRQATRFGEPDSIPINPYERTLAFNRYTQSTARFIWTNKLNNAQRLRDTLTGMVARGVPIISRQVLTSADSTDSQSFVLKTVFQFISGKEVTAVPIWAGDDTSVTYDPLNPVPSRWRRAIAVDPTGKYKAGDSVRMVINNEPAVMLPVVPLSAFYHVRITVADSANLGDFGPVNGDFMGVANDTSAQAVYMAVRPGNIALLMAMHVTGKETPNWTWQSFWWAIDSQNPQYGADRPATIPAPWNHYNMTVAYSMTDTKGAPIIAFDPYLETSLAGKLPPVGAGDSTSWTGVTSNCMSCHRRAAIGWGDLPPLKPGFDSVIASVTPPYGPAALVDAGDSVIFTQPIKGIPGRVPVLKTDFLWSVAIRSTFPNAGSRRK